MYITPNTTIKLLKNFPLTPDNRNQLFFANGSGEQYDVISKFTKHTLSEYSYQRVNKGALRVSLPAERVYDCNYMMFQNTAYGNQWFYAYITKCEYVNDATTEITYELDEWQTWFYSGGCTFKDCWIERQHTVTDEKYDHYEGEPFTVSQYVSNGDAIETIPESGTAWVAVICKTVNEDITGGDSTYVHNGVVGCTQYYAVRNSTQGMADFMSQVLEDFDQSSIVSAYLFPAVFSASLADGVSYVEIVNQHESRLKPVTEEMTVVLSGQLDGYTPVNKKLLSSPFSIVEVTDCNTSAAYRPEFFAGKDGNIKLTIYAKYQGTPEMMVVPKDYRGETENYSEAYTVGNFPMVETEVDTYRSWLAYNNFNNMYKAGSAFVGGVAGAVGSAVSGNIGGAVSSMVSAAGGIMQSINDRVTAAMQPDTLQTHNSSNIMSALYKKQIYIKSRCISASDAKQIDNYFTRYGYAINRLAQPNLQARPHFTYIKTSDAIINGAAPADAIQKMQDIVNDGCTFWVNPYEVGNFSIDNSPK